jgi:hypothetical protein
MEGVLEAMSALGERWRGTVRGGGERGERWSACGGGARTHVGGGRENFVRACGRR